MEHALELARLNADGTADDGVVNADILNISRGGIGFLSRKSLEVGTDPNSEWIPGYFPAVRDFTSVTINRLSSNFWMWNGSYIRLKNVELGYTLPQRITQKANIKQLRIYANLYNCLTFSSQKFFDPEQLESQYSFASYPQIMSFNVGINLKF